MRFLRSLFTRHTTRPSRSYRPCIEALEARRLLSSTPVPPSGLHDALVAPVAKAEFIQDNGHLSRGDVINLLDVVDGTETAVFTGSQVSFVAATPSPQATLTQAQLTDLQTIAANGSDWGLGADVANLFGKLVNHDPANVNYQGAVVLPTGRLSAGTVDTTVQDLVGKWFYGTDLPDVTAAAANNGIPDTVVYEPAAGTLFGPNGPGAHDVAQGWVPDCYFLSSLGEVAVQSPSTIESMFTNNGDGTYTVRFYEYDAANNTWRPEYVTVNLELPVLQQSGQFAFAGWYQYGTPTSYTSTTAVLWPALAEKAYAQLAEEGWSRYDGTGGSGNSSTPADWNTNSYDALSYGNGVAMQQITGSNIASDVALPNATSAAEKTLLNDFTHGSLIFVASPAQLSGSVPTNTAGAPLIITGHVYIVSGVDKANATFSLINPYDDGSVYASDGQRDVTLTWTQMTQYLNDAFVLAPPPVDPMHAVSQQGQTTGQNGDAQAMDIEWFVNGARVSSLCNVCQGDTVTVKFSTAAGINPTDFSLVSYAAWNGNFDRWNIDRQQEWAASTVTACGAGQYALTVVIPDGYFQLDFVQGDPIATFSTGELYHTDGRFIAATHGGSKVVA